MRRLFLLVAVAAMAALAGGSPGYGQDVEIDVETDAAAKVRQCLEAVGKAGSDPRACVGIAADSCLELPENSPPEANEACIVSETQVWESLMQVRYSELRGALSDEAGNRVEQVQNHWSDYRDRLCDLGSVVYEDKALVAIWRANCLLEETGRRAIELGALALEIKAQ